MQTIYLTSYDTDLIGKLRRDAFFIVVFCDTEKGDFTVYLPHFLSVSDKVFVFYNTSTNTVTLSARGEYIDTAETLAITSTTYSAVLVADTERYQSLLIGHARSHALDSTSDHTIGSLTSTYLVKSDGSKLVSATNTDAEVAAAVAASHARLHSLQSTSDHTGTGTENYIMKANANGLPANSVIIESSGNIGIGKVPANGVLDIAQAGSGSELIADFGTEGYVPLWLLRNDGTGNLYGFDLNDEGVVAHPGFYGLMFLQPNDVVKTATLINSDCVSDETKNIFGVSSNDSASGTTYYPRFVVCSNGNVGIGLNDPSSILHVVGDTFLDGALTLAGTSGREIVIHSTSAAGSNKITFREATYDVFQFLYNGVAASPGNFLSILAANGGDGVLDETPLTFFQSGKSAFGANTAHASCLVRFVSDNGIAIGAGDDCTITTPSDDLTISNVTSDKDIIFKGNDGGSVITALTLDMSEAGDATFNRKVTAALLKLTGLVEYADNVAALAGGLVAGDLYRNGDFVCVVH